MGKETGGIDIPNENKLGYSPTDSVRHGRAACRVSTLKWTMGKETGGSVQIQIQVLDIPNESKIDYRPTDTVRYGRAACRISTLKWQMGKETGGDSIPNEIKAGYSPTGFVRCGRTTCRTSTLKWKMGEETAGRTLYQQRQSTGYTTPVYQDRQADDDTTDADSADDG